jgi:cytochrome c oxidase assembly protein subunit 15
VSPARHHPWLHRFAVLTAAAAWVVICFGGLVTSHGAGLAVPDWPNTYGYNLFFFPISKWVGGIFYEHTHRLVASGVGLLTTVLAIWLWRAESRAWLRWLGVAAFVGVVLQGVIGGLRVILLRDHLGVFHGALAQLFFVLVCGIALFTSRWWREQLPQTQKVEDRGGLRRLALLTTLLVFGQLLLGATMRHRHAGLAIPDFPAAYGRLWPGIDAASVARYNQQREESTAVNPITGFDVVLQMAHRLGACFIALGVGLCSRVARHGLAPGHSLIRASSAWLVLVVLQFSLGAATVWTGKSADLATAHVAVGSLVLALGGLLTVSGFQLLQPSAIARNPALSCEVTPFRSDSPPAAASHRA